MSRQLEIGVLALQGDFAAHATALEQVGGCHAQPVRRAAELAPLDALILPGGESTTLARLLRELDLWDALGAFAATGKPVFGTCAGLILMADEVLQPDQPSLGLLPVTVIRNAYGRQIDSFVVPGQVIIPPDLPAGEILERQGSDGTVAAHGPPAAGLPAPEKRVAAQHRHRASFSAEFVFIRAPRISETREGVEILASYDGAPVLVRKGPLLGACFHPELSADRGVMRLFLALVRHVRHSAGVAH